MHRISITYPSTPGAPFNWDYYMNNHLPLAVGTSMRHSSISFCDADRPVNKNTPHACVCMVHFENEAGMVNFCNFFVRGHPESEAINNDEKNYTTIPPQMTAGDCNCIELPESNRKVDWRAKLFFPFDSAVNTSREEITSALKNFLDQEWVIETGVLSAELDFCSSGIVPGSEPEYSLIWTVGFAERNSVEKFSERLAEENNPEFPGALMRIKPRLMISQVMAFDLALTEPYR